MRLLDGHVLTGLCFPVFGKGRVELAVQLASRVIRHIEQGDRRGLRRGQTAHSHQGCG